MDDIEADIQCENCGKDFKMLANVYEKTVGLEQPVLCGECQYQEIVGHGLERYFEYCDINFEQDFTQLGIEGWELVAIYNSEAYFKRELFK